MNEPDRGHVHGLALCAVLGSIMAAGCQPTPAGIDGAATYFDQTPPGEQPVVFAPGIVSREDRFEQFLAYSSDGRTVTFGVTNADWTAFTLLQMTREDGAWSEADTAPFLGDSGTGLTVAMSPDGETAYFTDARPAYPPGSIWRSHRSGNGWSEPLDAGPPLSTDADEWEVAMSADGTLYFSSSRAGGEGDLDIYRAPLINGGYPKVENLGPPVNTSAGDDLPFIAPDERYLIFASNRPGGFGERDLYITFRVNGAWTDPQNLGPGINSKDWNIYPFVSADGKYLFYTIRKGGFEASEDSDIYWVRADFIERLRKTAIVADQK